MHVVSDKSQQLHNAESATSPFEYLPDLVLRFDRSLRCTYANTAVERASGSVRGSFLGRRLVDICVPADLAGVWELALRRVFERAAPETLEAALQYPRGEWLLHAVMLPEPLITPPRADSVLVIAHDMTQHRPLTRELEGLVARLREHDRNLQDLIERLGTPAHYPPSDANRDLLLRLTVHERDLLRLVAEGRSNAEIGQALHLSPGTVRNQLTRLYLKLGVSDRTHAAARAVALGLVSGQA